MSINSALWIMCFACFGVGVSATIMGENIYKLYHPLGDYQIIIHEKPSDRAKYLLLMDGDRTVTKITSEQDKVLDSIIINDNQ